MRCETVHDFLCTIVFVKAQALVRNPSAQICTKAKLHIGHEEDPRYDEFLHDMTTQYQLSMRVSEFSYAVKLKNHLQRRCHRMQIFLFATYYTTAYSTNFYSWNVSISLQSFGTTTVLLNGQITHVFCQCPMITSLNSRDLRN